MYGDLDIAIFLQFRQEGGNDETGGTRVHGVKLASRLTEYRTGSD